MNDGMSTSQSEGVSVPSRLNSRARVRRDLRFMWIYVYTVPRTLTYAAPVAEATGEVTSAQSVSRIEEWLAIEATRYRRCGLAIVALLAAIPLLAAFLWSGMSWLPVTVYWWPFARGNYGLPFFSLFEWLCYLLLAIYFVVTFQVLRGGRAQTRRLADEFRRLLAGDDARRTEVVSLVRGGAAPRTEFLLRKAPVFSAYRDALAAGASS